MARTSKCLPDSLDLAHLISAGVLINSCPRTLIDEVLKQTGRGSQRERLLTAPTVVYYVMAMALWRDAPLEEVLRIVCEGANWLNIGAGAHPHNLQLPTKSAISAARNRLGAKVMQGLAQRVLRPLATPETRGAWYRGWRLMGLDGTVLDVADEQANADYFGYPPSSRGSSAFPQLRLVNLVECGTHVITAAQLGSCRQSEQTLAERLLPEHLRSDELLMADRGFYSFKLWSLATQCGGKLLWRVKSTVKLPVEECLSDGSYLSTTYELHGRNRKNSHRVRVVEFTLVDEEGQLGERYRLVTNLLVPEEAPAAELAALYHERWEVENVFDELKTHLRGASTVLRSKKPELVKQEMWGFLLAHFAIRQLMIQAADKAAIDPDRLGFTNAVWVVRRKLPQAAAFPP